MCDLIVMTRPTGPSRYQPPMGGSAEILFFTGVRYVRMVDEVGAATVGSPKTRRAEKAKKHVPSQRVILT